MKKLNILLPIFLLTTLASCTPGALASNVSLVSMHSDTASQLSDVGKDKLLKEVDEKIEKAKKEQIESFKEEIEGDSDYDRE